MLTKPPVHYDFCVLNVKALVGAFNEEKALVGAFSVIVQPVVEPMEHYTALVRRRLYPPLSPYNPCPCTPLKVSWPWTSLNKLKEQFNSRSGGTEAESYEYSKYPILPRAGWVKTLWNMSGGSEKNGDVAAGGVGTWRAGGGCCHQSEVVPQID